MSPSDRRPPSIEHQPAQQRFVGPGGAVLEYRLEEDRMIFARTFVPEALRGHSLAAHLTEAALRFARSHRYEVVPECRYTAVYLRRHSP
mgnify:FL=1|jgi:hypothetical protein